MAPFHSFYAHEHPFAIEPPASYCKQENQYAFILRLWQTCLQFGFRLYHIRAGLRLLPALYFLLSMGFWLDLTSYPTPTLIL